MNRSPQFSVGLLLLLLVPAGASQTPAPRTQRRPPARTGPAYFQKLRSFEETPALTKAVLRNGLTVLVQEFRVHPLVSITTYARGGMHGEEGKSTGYPHILGRMFFRATTAKAPGTVSRDIRAMGGVQSSLAEADGTFHDLVVPSAQWKKALEIHAQALTSFALDNEDLNREMGSLMRADAVERAAPDFLAQAELMNVAFGRSRYSFSTPELTGGAMLPSREELIEYCRVAYDPSQVILAIAGEVNAPEVLTEVVRLYDRPKGAPIKPPARPPRMKQNEFRYGAVTRTGTDGVVLVGFHVPPATAAEHPALEVLCAMLGAGEESVLAHRLRDRKNAILRGEARLEGCEHAGYLTIGVTIEPGSFDRSEIALLTELEILKRSEPEEEDLERAKAQVERDYWLSQQTLSDRAHGVIRYESAGDWKKSSEFLSQIRQIKPADVTRVTRDYLRIENCTIVESLPSLTEARNVNAETLSSTFQTLLGTAVEQELAERERETRLAIDVPGPAGTFKVSEIRYPMRRASILRGPELFIQEDHATPLLSVGVFLPGGRLFEDRSNAGITGVLIRALLLASRGEEACRLRRQIEIYGGRILPIVQDDCFGALLVVLARHAEPSLEILGKLLELPKFDKEDFAKLRSLALNPMVQPGGVGVEKAIDKVRMALFGGHAYSLPGSGTDAGVKVLAPEALASWYAGHVHNKKPTVVIIGDTQGTSLAAFFVKRYSGGRFQDVKLPDAFVQAPGKRVTLDEKWNGEYGLALLGFSAPPAADEDLPAMSVLKSHFAGTNGRLAEVLRERLPLGGDTSLIYTPQARGGTCILYAAVKPGDEQQATAIMEEEIRNLIEHPMLYKDYRAAVNMAIGEYLVAQQDRAARILTLVNGLIAGVPLELVADRAASFQQVTEENVSDVVGRVLNLEKSVTLRIRAEPRKP